MTLTAMVALLFSAAALSNAQDSTRTWEGYLADQMCAYRWRGDLADSYAKRHAKSCNFDEDCMASGYGIMVNGTFIKLTPDSKDRAVEYLESTPKRNDIYVRVTGMLEGKEIRAERIEDARAVRQPTDTP